jgi:hypothetical protein
MPSGTLPLNISSNLLRKSRAEVEKPNRHSRFPLPPSETCPIEKGGRKEYVSIIRVEMVTASLETTASTSTRDRKGVARNKETPLYLSKPRRREK